MNHQKELNKRALSFGVNSLFITLTVVAIVGVVNFLGKQYPKKFDLTKNKIHTFSDQTEKVVKGLKSDLSATLYGDMGSKEKFRPLFDNYKKLSPKFKYEVVDPNKEPTRAKTAGIKKMDTLTITYDGKTSKLEELSEEKITNEIIKLTKEVKSTVCTVVGHGEISFNDQGATGFAAAKKGLEDQAYAVKEITLSQEQKVPSECTALVMLGASKALFPAEISALNEYLMNGGRLIVGVDAAVTDKDQTAELKKFLSDWGIDLKGGLILDPISKRLGVDASVPIMATFNKESPILKDFQSQCYFPFSRPVEPSSKAVEGLKILWLAKSTPNSWSEMNMAGIAKGVAQMDAGTDPVGPLTTAVSVSGKRKEHKGTRDMRLVAIGSGQFANNQYSRFGGNLDFFLNSVSWVLEDESMISIRSNEDEAGKVELTANQGLAIFWISVVIIPILIAALGIVIWVRRKKL